MKIVNQKYFNQFSKNLDKPKNRVFLSGFSATTRHFAHGINNESFSPSRKENDSLKKSLNNVLNPVLLVNFPANKKDILLYNLREEKQLYLITEFSESIFNTIRKKKKKRSNYSDPVQFLFRQLQIFSSCICVRVIKIIYKKSFPKTLKILCLTF